QPAMLDVHDAGGFGHLPAAQAGEITLPHRRGLEFGVEDVATFAACAADDHHLDAAGAVVGIRRCTFTGLVVRVRVDREHAKGHGDLVFRRESGGWDAIGLVYTD